MLYIAVDDEIDRLFVSRFASVTTGYHTDHHGCVGEDTNPDTFQRCAASVKPVIKPSSVGKSE